MGPAIVGEGSTENSSIEAFHFSIPTDFFEQYSGLCTTGSPMT